MHVFIFFLSMALLTQVLGLYQMVVNRNANKRGNEVALSSALWPYVSSKNHGEQIRFDSQKAIYQVSY